ncbi:MULTISPECIES: hypothetical protein [Myxococcus]|uniref:Uncharacterized protein n=1 Tax=Myxococcus fulvus TaxID=33 RepID=A0A511TEK0_MYXFU|nr:MULTISPECIES: hypothetical protein [Myxococcus]AKF86176.1 hypothetical protein MFUL124B02_22915 [Myxococcus fulvus 124B02]MBZ4397536.1 hypothetical protein [Myxococcus sp. AS-1-15]GEN12595.1 hypothetical protein MFU01_76320 [Myxococcus fulvus]SET84554.1 hypothetical protein SAMN05443572_103473 [Myxococcus fulvus]
MNEPKKTVAAKRKLTLHRETLRSMDEGALQMLDGVVGGTGTTNPYTNFPSGKCGVIETSPEVAGQVDP